MPTADLVDIRKFRASPKRPRRPKRQTPRRRSLEIVKRSDDMKGFVVLPRPGWSSAPSRGLA
jgi:hypothetical protein